MTPGDREPATAPPAPLDSTAAAPLRAYRWYHKTTAVLFATVCLEIGFFLLIFPWTSAAGDFAAFAWPEWRLYWDSPFVRGAVSGLGVVNLYISFVEIYHLRRFAKR